MKANKTLFFVAVLLPLLNACQSDVPPPPDPPAAPNCAADGPGCQQFNPDKPLNKK